MLQPLDTLVASPRGCLYCTGKPKTGPCVQMQPHECQTEGTDHFLGPVGYAFTNVGFRWPSLAQWHSADSHSDWYLGPSLSLGLKFIELDFYAKNDLPANQLGVKLPASESSCWQDSLWLQVLLSITLCHQLVLQYSLNKIHFPQALQISTSESWS